MALPSSVAVSSSTVPPATLNLVQDVAKSVFCSRSTCSPEFKEEFKVSVCDIIRLGNSPFDSDGDDEISNLSDDRKMCLIVSAYEWGVDVDPSDPESAKEASHEFMWDFLSMLAYFGLPLEELMRRNVGFCKKVLKQVPMLERKARAMGWNPGEDPSDLGIEMVIANQVFENRMMEANMDMYQDLSFQDKFVLGRPGVDWFYSLPGVLDKTASELYADPIIGPKLLLVFPSLRIQNTIGVDEAHFKRGCEARDRFGKYHAARRIEAKDKDNPHGPTLHAGLAPIKLRGSNGQPIKVLAKIVQVYDTKTTKTRPCKICVASGGLHGCRVHKKLADQYNAKVQF